MNQKPLYQTIPIDPQPQIIYNQALILCKQNDYYNALVLFVKVYEMVPNFPCIGNNIIQCDHLYRIHKVYQDGLTLLDKGHFLEAWKHFVFIENNLQRNFLQCRDLIQKCEQLLDEILQQLQQLEEQERQQRLQQRKDQFEQMFKRLKAPLSQNEIQNNNSEDIEQIIREEKKQRQEIKRIQIYYTCIKEIKCENQCIKEPIKHLDCQTTAYLGADGYISCESSCEKYFITDALFNCQQKTVQKISENVDLNNFEQLTSFYLIGDFNNDCLEKAETYHKQDKEDFLLNFPVSELIQRKIV